MKLIDGDKLERHLDYLIQKEKQLAKECSLSPNNEFERQRRYCFEANALAYGLCENVMNYYLIADTQVNEHIDKLTMDYVQNEVLNYLFNKEREAESMPYSNIRQERIATLREVIRYVEGIGDTNE